MPLHSSVVAEALVQLDRELGPIDPDTRAIVGLRPDIADTVALVDVTMADNGVLTVTDEVAGLVVVTHDEWSKPGSTDAGGITRLVCIRRDGTEFGLYRRPLGTDPQIWRMDVEAEGAAWDPRPRGMTTNTARRAFQLPSLVDPIPFDPVLVRLWLTQVASAALQAFDAPDGPDAVGPDAIEAQLGRASPMIDRFTADPTDGPDDAFRWERLHRAALRGELDLGGTLTIDADHAAWLDPPGFAQVLDRMLPTRQELLGSLQVTGTAALQDWVRARLPG